MLIHLLSIALATLTYAQKPEEPKPVPATTPTELKLEEFLEKALSNSAEVALAEAKVRLAEAELFKARQTAITKYSSAYYDLQSAKKRLAASNEDLKDSKRLFETASISSAEYRKASLENEAANLEVTKLAADLDRLKAVIVPPPSRPQAKLDEAAADPDGIGKSLLAENPKISDLSANQKRFLTMLDIEIEAGGSPELKELFNQINSQLSDKIEKGELPKWNVKAGKELEGVVTGKMPLGSLLEFIQDAVGGVFVLREYGFVHIGSREGTMPIDSHDNFRDSMPAVKLWKQVNAAKTGTGKEKVPVAPKELKK